MDYNLIYTIDELRKYVKSADVIAFDFETAPDDEWRYEPKTALDAHKAHIVGISLSVSRAAPYIFPLHIRPEKMCRAAMS